jgi:hypothetical protein
MWIRDNEPTAERDRTGTAVRFEVTGEPHYALRRTEDGVRA